MADMRVHELAKELNITSCLFMRNPSMVLTKGQILDKLWDCDGNYIDSSTPVSYTHLEISFGVYLTVMIIKTLSFKLQFPIRRMITIGCHSCFFQALIYTLPDLSLIHILLSI